VQRSTKRKKQGSVVRDWKPLLEAMKDVIDWALDIAVALAKDLDEDKDAIEKVRSSFHAWLDGRPSEIEISDLLVTFGTILAAIEIDLGIDSTAALSPMQAVAESLPVLRFPARERATADTVVIRKPSKPRFRNCRFAA
jgi:hypothetical protein